jgi:hypothetical protein
MTILPNKRNGYLSVWCNQLLDWCWRNRVLNSQDIVREEMPDGVRLRIVNKVAVGGTPGFPWGENYTFGITQTAADKLKVWKGKFRRWGDQTYNADDTEVTFTGDGDQWLVWRWSESSGLEIQSTPQNNYPVEADSTYIYGPIHKVNLTAGMFTLLDACQDGIVNAPIFTAPGV